MVLDEHLKDFKKEFKEYLKNKNPDWNIKKVEIHSMRAFFAYNDDVDILFWESLLDEESLDKAKERILSYLSNELDFNAALVYTDEYFSDMKALKDFFDERYNGVENLLNQEYKYIQEIYKISKDALDKINGNADYAYSEKCYIKIFENMINGKKFTLKCSDKVIVYFIKKIAIDYGKENLINALKATTLYIKYLYEKTKHKLNNLRKACEDISLEYNLNISFKDDIFNGINFNNFENSYIFQGSPKYYDVIGAILDLDFVTWKVRQYSNQIKEGDRAYIYLSGEDPGIIAKGIVSCSPEANFSDAFDPYIISDNFRYTNDKTVDIKITNKFVDKKISKDLLLSDEHLKNLKIISEPNKTNYLITSKQADIFNKMIDGTYFKKDPKKPYSREDFLKDVYIDRSDYEDLMHLLKYKKNIIIEGPPGVGKTFAAKRLAYSILGNCDESHIMMVQFHQSYSYEDFIMGFRPTKDGFELKEGPFYNFCKEAEKCLDEDYFFIIDEINRGNLSKIFGELLVLIENDKRGEKLRLIYRGELFSVPKNLYLIGLMNTADRSLATMDYALRRRFAFFQMKPAFNNENFKEMILKSNNENLNRLIECIVSLNQLIRSDESLGEGFEIGHSYFCTGKDFTIFNLRALIKYEFIPLIKEYWYLDRAKIDKWTKKLYDSIE